MSMWLPAPEPETPLGRVRILSPTCGLRVSPIQFGAMSLGSSWASSLGPMDKEKSFAILDAFRKAGGNFIDTANNYQDGQSEEWVGDWMAERGNRDQMVIATKYTSDYLSWSLGKGNAPNHLGNHKKSMHMSVRDSLKKLKTDYIDILYLHWWDHTTSIEEVMDGLDILVKSGKVLYLGISDSPAWVVSAANTYATAHNKTPFVIYQGKWNVLDRSFEREIIPMAKHFGMALAPWDVLCHGRLNTVKAHKQKEAGGEKMRTFGSQDDSLNEAEMKMVGILEEIAEENGLGDNVPAVAIAYLMAKTPNVFPLVGGRNPKYIAKNVKALEIKMSEEQIKKIEGAMEFDHGFPHNFIGFDPKDGGPVVGLTAANAKYEFVMNPKPVGY
ncbi:hypothetical protein MKZ38_007161 [Zalerion maritima]|uniref:NADP-dependent oxidoreductase domain-containing protein n=1 Tax=Zalerion maritima TaxID=339359 RepID=A0AAD5RW81_9PEZI|nr:hypothetical protein MKZ38_007161 [Zalerion maritima]